MADNKNSQILGMQEKQLKDYANFFEKNKLKELYIEESGLKVTFKKDTPKSFIPTQVSMPVASAVNTNPEADNNVQPIQETAEKIIDSDLFQVKAPVVGTYYSSPSPDSPPFVQIGDSVNPDTVICIIEAMKNMNEIKAGTSGIVQDIILKNSDPVTTNQTIMTIKKA